MPESRRLIFDADNTLFDFNQAEALALSATLSHFELPQPAGLLDFYRNMNTRLWQQLDENLITIKQLKNQRTGQLFAFIGASADPAEFSEQYLTALSEQQCLLPDVEPILDRLSQHCEMAIITNGLARVQTPRFESSRIKNHFKHMVISEKIGVAKPNPAIFAHTCELMGWRQPAEVMMIGDNYRCDVVGAAKFGMQTCWFNLHRTRHDYSDHDHEIHEFKQLLKVLDV